MTIETLWQMVGKATETNKLHVWNVESMFFGINVNLSNRIPLQFDWVYIPETWNGLENRHFRSSRSGFKKVSDNFRSLVEYLTRTLFISRSLVARGRQHPRPSLGKQSHWTHFFQCEDNSVVSICVQPYYYRMRLIEPCHQLGEVARRSSWAVELLAPCLSSVNNKVGLTRSPKRPCSLLYSQLREKVSHVHMVNVSPLWRGPGHTHGFILDGKSYRQG